MTKLLLLLHELLDIDTLLDLGLAKCSTRCLKAVISSHLP